MTYDRIRENAFLDVNVANTSTFSIDVDTASYANVRRLLEQDQLPPPDAVRIEEMVNYFRYDYEAPGLDAEHPFRAHVEIAGCPWNSDHRLARIALKGKAIPFEDRPPMNLVFLIDVSGSMNSPNKLTLVKQAAKKLVAELGPSDQMAIVVYAGAAGLVLPTTPCNEQEKIFTAIDRLQAGGSTNGGQGIQLAYDTAASHFIKDGVNRVILATDGDFNVGVSNTGSLVRLVEDRAKEGIYLSVLGFGMGNYNDAMLEQISNSGNGNYAYIDNLDEACRVLVDGLGGTLVTIAKDVKIQIFFNPKYVAGYRLIGYENRMLQAQDFNNDTVDAGEIGVGHAVTALYEIVPAGTDLPSQAAQIVDDNPFIAQSEASPVVDSDAWFRLRMRYKEPTGETSTLMEEDATDSGTAFDQASSDFQWAASVASFGMQLRKSEHVGTLTMGGVLEIAESNLGEDQDGSRNEMLRLLQRAKELLNRR